MAAFETRKALGMEQFDFPEEFSGNSSQYWKIVKETTSNLNVKYARIYFDSYVGDTFANAENRFKFDEYLKSLKEYPDEYAVINQLLAHGAVMEHTESHSLHHQFTGKYSELGEICNQLKQELEQSSDLDEPITEKDVGIANGILDLYAEIESISNERDKFVARRIAETLQEGETGILFMGVIHDIVSKLPADIQVTLLDERLNEFREVQEGRRRLNPEWLLDETVKGPERK